MANDQITALAREYAEEATKVMTSNPNLSDSEINDIKHDVSEWAEEILRFLLRRFCLVEKKDVEAKHQEAKERYFSPDDEIEKAMYGGRMSLLEYLFPEIAKESNEILTSSDKLTLGKQEKDTDTVINGWVARDKNGDLVCCAGSKPFKEEKMPFWKVDFRNFIECIPNDLFPDLTWESEPEQVEIIIKRKKK